MDATVSEWLNLVFRWIHVVAGIMWVGHLYWFNFVNLQVAKTYDADTKKKVIPELLPRALYWFRWGAAYTWLSGLLLLGIVYYMGGVMGEVGAGMGTGVGLATLVVGFFLYDVLWKSPLGKNEMAGVAVSFLLAVAVAFGLGALGFSGRAVFMHVGALFGTIMAGNVWMRIWPAQRKVIAAIKGTGPAPDPSLPATAVLRSKHNTYLSVPLVLTMVSNHFPTVYGSDMGWAILAALILVGWGATKWVYTKSGTPAPMQIGDAAAAAAPAPAAPKA